MVNSAREMWTFGQHFLGQEKFLSGPLSSIHPGPSFSFALNLWYARSISDFEEASYFHSSGVNIIQSGFLFFVARHEWAALSGDALRIHVNCLSG
jgi:hypothetical protein